MSLKDPDDEYDDLVPEKRKGKVGKAASATKKILIILITGMIIGAVLSHFYIEPFINDAQTSVCKDCLAAKELLGKENECLYQFIPDAQGALTACIQTPEPAPEPTPDQNEPTPDQTTP